MGRPKKETYKIDERYIEEALLLAGRYSESVKRRDQLRNLMTEANRLLGKKTPLQQLTKRRTRHLPPRTNHLIIAAQRKCL